MIIMLLDGQEHSHMAFCFMYFVIFINHCEV